MRQHTIQTRQQLPVLFWIDEPDLAAVIDFRQDRKLLVMTSMDAVVWTGLCRTQERQTA